MLTKLCKISTDAFPSHKGNDSLFLNITLHVCGQIKILKANFVDIDVRSPQVCSRFNELIQRHGHLMRLGKKLADTISFVLLAQLFITSILLCIMGKYYVACNDFAKTSALLHRDPRETTKYRCRVPIHLSVEEARRCYVGEKLRGARFLFNANHRLQFRRGLLQKPDGRSRTFSL